MKSMRILFWCLIAVFAAGLALIAVGLGITTKLAATGCGIVLCFAAVRLLAGGPPR